MEFTVKIILLKKEPMTAYSTLGLTLLKPGSMLPESTTTTGDSLPVTHINPFHIISAEVTIIPGKKNIQKQILPISLPLSSTNMY